MSAKYGFLTCTLFVLWDDMILGYMGSYAKCRLCQAYSNDNKASGSLVPAPISGFSHNFVPFSVPKCVHGWLELTVASPNSQLAERGECECLGQMWNKERNREMLNPFLPPQAK